MMGKHDVLTPKISACIKELKVKKQAVVSNGRRFSTREAIIRIHSRARHEGIKVSCLDVGWKILVTKV